MELDKRIKEGKRPLNCFDVDIAKQFIGKKGYFSHYIDNYADLKNTVLGELGSMGDTFHESFCCSEEAFDNYYYEFFLPAEWVKEHEKKYRPYSLNEFLSEHEVGDKITYRLKLDKQSEDFIRNKVMICGYQFVTGNANIPGKGFINLGGSLISLQTLFDTYETPNNYLYPEVWQPFGVVDKAGNYKK